MTPAQWRALALAYDALAVYNPAARPAWDGMARDEKEQYSRLAHRVRFEPWKGNGQPYANSAEMHADVRRRRHLYVFVGGNPHPCRTPAEVFRGRAVHDVLGHALPGNDFSSAGELAAFRAHAPHYGPDALPALACDNLGQTAYYYFHPVNAGKPHSARTWPAQKVDLLPEVLWRHLL